MTGAIDFLQAALQLAPLLIKAGEDIAVFAQWVFNTISREPTEADWAALKAKEKELEDVLLAPLPPEEGQQNTGGSA